MNRLILRIAKPADTEEAFALFQIAFQQLRDVYRPSQALLSQQTGRSLGRKQLLASLNDQIVGTVHFETQQCKSQQCEPQQNNIRLIGLAVHPDFQRQGIARSLIDWIATQSSQQGAKNLTLATITETGNVPVFGKLGFQIVSEKVADWCESGRYD